MKAISAFLMACLTLSLCSVLSAHEPAVKKGESNLVERLGTTIPPWIHFTDEHGTKVDLRAIVNKPTIIAPIYFGCTNECPLMLTALARTLGATDLIKPGKDFQVIALSFDDHDTPAVAAQKKTDYLKAVGRPFPAEAWRFLTGDQADIDKLMAAIGFTVRRDGKDFSHPISLVILSPNGTIVRYLEGVSYLPFEITMAVNEASEGKIGGTARRALSFCFSYDKAKKSYVPNILKITGAAMVLFVGGFFVYLMATSKGRQ